jgi:crotonobetainyl-CoA:carnitine CoA-transferase CaiB-like acyl-CoA transferase
MSINGEPGGQSLKMPVALIDILAAHQLKEGILLSMLRQTRSGEGDFVEVSLIQTAISSLANQATNWLIGGKIPQKQGSAHPNIAPYGDVFSTVDGREILLAIGTDKQFSACYFMTSPKQQRSQVSTNQSRSNRAYLRKYFRAHSGVEADPS